MPKCPAWREGDFGLKPFSYDICYATKEMEKCECLGNEAFCDFYPEKRKAAIKPKNGEWIGVKDRLPKHEENVLLHFGKFMGVGYYDEADQSFYDAADDYELVNVTHWMPLPKPPKEE